MSLTATCSANAPEGTATEPVRRAPEVIDDPSTDRPSVPATDTVAEHRGAQVARTPTVSPLTATPGTGVHGVAANAAMSRASVTVAPLSLASAGGGTDEIDPVSE